MKAKIKTNSRLCSVTLHLVTRKCWNKCLQEAPNYNQLLLAKMRMLMKTYRSSWIAIKNSVTKLVNQVINSGLITWHLKQLLLLFRILFLLSWPRRWGKSLGENKLRKNHKSLIKIWILPILVILQTHISKITEWVPEKRLLTF